MGGLPSEISVSQTEVKEGTRPLDGASTNNGTLQRRVSPRLHQCAENVGASNSGSFVKKRLSPRLNRNMESELQNDAVSISSTAGRRVSPRLNKNMESELQNDVVLISSTAERRVSPRPFNNCKSKIVEDGLNGINVQRRFGSTNEDTHGSEALKAESNALGIKRRVSPRFHNMNKVEIRESRWEESTVEGWYNSISHVNGECKILEDLPKETRVEARRSPRLKTKIQVEELDVSNVRKRLRMHVESTNPSNNYTSLEFSQKGLHNGDVDSSPTHGATPKRVKFDLLNEDNRLVQQKNNKRVGSHQVVKHPSSALRVKEGGTRRENVLSPKFVHKSDIVKVKETLRMFNTYYLQFVQEEEERCKKIEADTLSQSRGSKSKMEYGPIVGHVTDDYKNKGANYKRPSKRPDLKAMAMMKDENSILFPKKQFGHIPGIDVGYQFYSRAEMCVIGFHGHWLNGIDYMGEEYAKLEEYKGQSFPLAVAIVVSGQYEDDKDSAEDIVYTGQGGNDLLGNKRQVQDQVMVRGNLALKNNMEQSLPVRVVRGHASSNSYSGKVYTYDGLYNVVDYWAEKGISGFTVFKYRLKRHEGQPKLTTNQVKFVRGRGSTVFTELPGLVSVDISNGKESKCIPATNLYDDPPCAPTGFSYSTKMKVTESVKVPPDATGCACKGKCTNPRTCACAKLNGMDFPYVFRDGGRLIEPKDVVFECGPNCGCGPDCVNRISQRPMKYRLEVYQTPNKGWAVRSWDFIPSGAPVCEYIGVLRRSDELEDVAENDFIFEIDCLHTMNEIEGRERRSGDGTVPIINPVQLLDGKGLDSTPEFSIDAGSYGNVTRFINHSCEPNLFVQCVLSSHHDLRLARIVLFAADNIPPLQELTYDYGYALDSVVGLDGQVKVLPCHCGTSECRKRLY